MVLLISTGRQQLPQWDALHLSNSLVPFPESFLWRPEAFMYQAKSQGPVGI